MRLRLWLFGFVISGAMVVLGACGPDGESDPPADVQGDGTADAGETDTGSQIPVGLESSFQQSEATDQAASDDERVEVHLTVDENGWEYSNAVETSAMTYNGEVPSPRIRAKVGQTLEVKVTNKLDEVTSIHFHGVDLPAKEDGSNFSQPGLPPGKTWTYEFEVHQATLAWFHPHFNTDEQIGRGLYGMLVFEDPAISSCRSCFSMPRKIKNPTLARPTVTWRRWKRSNRPSTAGPGSRARASRPT
ncbi:MAG: multicopper oxidase family protein [Bradymonadaceae bacterium]